MVVVVPHACAKLTYRKRKTQVQATYRMLHTKEPAWNRLLSSLSQLYTQEEKIALQATYEHFGSDITTDIIDILQPLT
jgi:hypothetical protein